MFDRQFIEQVFNKDFCYAYFGSLINGVVIINRDGYITYTNKKYLTILGLSNNDIVGQHMSTIAPNAIALQVLKSKVPAYFHRTIVPTYKADVLVSAYPILNDMNNIIGVICVLDEVKNIIDLANTLNKHNDLLNFNRKITNDEECEKIIGKNKDFLRCVHALETAAKTNIPILLIGETGTGKELFSNFIHQKSLRATKNIVKINCSTIPEQLFESELFGYDEGAFTGAKKSGKLGKIELADQGTLFLDEIGDLPLMLQPKLLRLLEDGVYEKLGSTRIRKSDIRFICATNKDLDKLVADGDFRADLYYRINNITLKIPPLRERSDDIPLLVDYYLALFNKRYNRNVSIQDTVIGLFQLYNWPGNIRELRNLIEYRVIMCHGDTISKDDLPDNFLSRCSSGMNKAKYGSILTQNDKSFPKNRQSLTFKSACENLEKELIIDAIKNNNFNKSRAIKQLGISRYTFYKKLKQFDITTALS